MATLQSVGRKILTYISPSAKEQSAYFKLTRDISEAQFYLGNRFQEIYLWQEVADRDMEVSRIENLLYGCFFHDDEEAMAEADSVYKIYQSDQAFSTLSANTYIGNTTNTTFTSFGLDNAKRYFFKVTGVNKQGYEGAPASIAISPTHTGPIWWLATDGNDANDGSIGGPLATLHKAMEKAASGDTIMLKPGTYYFRDMEYPSEVGNPISGYSRKTFEKLVIRSQKGASNTVIDAGYQGRHFNMEIDPNTSMDSTFQFIGLTFKGGRSNDRGGSFVIESYSSGFSGGGHPITRPKFVDCIFRDNAAGNSSSNNSSYGEGGAIYSGNANPIFENCVFDSNYATSGGAIYLSGNPESVAYTPTYIRNSKFTDNSASDGGSNFASAQGGALTIGSVRHIIISNSSFTNNSATSLNSSARGGAIYIGSDWDPVNVDEVLNVFLVFFPEICPSRITFFNFISNFYKWSLINTGVLIRSFKF